MFCPKCGNSINENADFCPNCGMKIQRVNNEKSNTIFQSNVDISNNFTNQSNNVENNININQSIISQSQQTLSEQLATNNPLVSVFEKIKKYIHEHKKYFLIGCSCIFIIIISLVIYNNLFSFSRLKWNKKYLSISLDYLTQGNVELGVLFSDEKNIDKLKFYSDCGKVENEGIKINWDLTNSIGKCEITVKYKMKKISKKFNVIAFNGEQTDLSFDYKINDEFDEDLDLDGLTNKEEKKYKTNPELFDSDMDGLDDKYELFTSKTDPNKKDSDDDDLNDYDEIQLNYNPLKSDSKGDGIKDGQRKNTFLISNDELGVNLEITGNGNIASSTINSFTNSSFTKIDGLLDKIYNLYTAGNLDSAIIKIKYSLEEIQTKGLNEDNLTLFYFNDDTKELEKIPTTVDKENKIVTVSLKHFSKYVLGDSNAVLTNQESKIMFVIDNSVSMYSNHQMDAAGYDSVGALGNDTSFKRLSLTNNMIDMFTGNYKFGIAEFSGNYVNLNKFTNTKAIAKKSVNSMKSNFKSDLNGTNIIIALRSGIKEFTNGGDNNYLILLTDGKNTDGELSYYKSSIISSAKAKDVKICVIGLGSDIDTNDLNEIAESSGCDYYNASDARALQEIYSIIGSNINYNLIDIDGDGKVDGTVIADSGFIVTRDGFSFKNYGTNFSPNGHCYGMATFAELYYNKKLPLNLSSKTVGEKKSYSYNLNETYFSDYSSLYNYRLKTNLLKYTFGFDSFGEKTPSDFRQLNDDVLIINDKYKQEITNSNLFDINVQESKLSNEKQLQKWGINYKISEDILLNEDSIQNSSKIKNDDKQLINAIYASFIKQNATKNYSSSSDFILWLRNLIGTESSKKISSNAFVYLLKTRISSGDVPVITSTYNEGLHSINAISLVQDIDDANHYYIGVYDNNYPGEKRYVDIKCTKNTCVTKSNKYYNDSNQPIRISVSLDDDLNYFK